MNYKEVYTQLMKKGESRGLDKNLVPYYTEYHHKKARCQGGSDDKENLVLLTAREHYLAHWLLTKIFPKNRKLKFGLTQFSRKLNGRKLKRKEITRAREEMAKAHRNKIVSEETRRKQSESGRKRKPPSEETRKKLSESAKRTSKQRFTKETREKIGDAHRGKTLTQKHRKQVSNSLKGKRARGAKKEIYHWLNIETGEEEICCKADFVVNHPYCSRSQVFHVVNGYSKKDNEKGFGERISVKGWIILEKT